jgi:hypothetical protein
MGAEMKRIKASSDPVCRRAKADCFFGEAVAVVMATLRHSCKIGRPGRFFGESAMVRRTDTLHQPVEWAGSSMCEREAAHSLSATDSVLVVRLCLRNASAVSQLPGCCRVLEIRICLSSTFAETVGRERETRASTLQ